MSWKPIETHPLNPEGEAYSRPFLVRKDDGSVACVRYGPTSMGAGIPDGEHILMKFVVSGTTRTFNKTKFQEWAEIPE